MNDRTEFLDPEFEPGEFDAVEGTLRHSLEREAARVRPSDRLDAILLEANSAGPVAGDGSSRSRRWLLPVAAAAAVAAIAGGVWWSGQDNPVTPTPPASSAPSVEPTTPPSATDSATTPVGQTQAVTLPVYFVGPVGDAKPTYKLFREFVRHDVPTPATDAVKAKAALVLAVNAQPYSNTDGYLQPWSGQTIGDVTVAPDLITIDLANPGADGFDAETQRLAVQELVWTAQAAVGKGNIPVGFQVQGGGKLFGSIPTDHFFNRPPAAESWQDLAPIWVNSPTRDQVLPATKDVTVTGEATVFEATVSWELTRGGSVVKKGFETASVGAPERGTYSIALGRLPAGDYTIRVWEASAKDGSVAAERSIPFTVK